MKKNIMHILLAMLICFVCAGFGLKPEAPVDQSWVESEEVQPLCGKEIPWNKLRGDFNVFYTGLQIGDGTNDVMYLAFDYKEEGKYHDEIQLYVPDHVRYGKPYKIKGRRRGDAYLFSIRKIEGQCGGVKIKYDIDMSVRSLWKDRRLDVDVEIKCDLSDIKNRRKSKFTLKGGLNPRVNKQIDIEIVKLIQLPEIKGRWDKRSDPPHVRGRIMMGGLSFIPVSGIGANAYLEVVDKETSNKRVSQKVRIKPEGAYSEFTYDPGRKLKEGKEYELNLSVDLAPFFGKFSVSDNVVLK